MKFYINTEDYLSEDTFIKIPKTPKPLDGYNPKGKKKNKKDYSQERERKRNTG
jgi:hypothetical protein